MITKYWVKTREFSGMPNLGDFKLIEEEIDDDLKEGEILTEAIVISVDPYIRFFPIPPGQPIVGFQAAKVLKSAIDEYPVGSIVMYHGGWQTIKKTKKEDVWYRVDHFLSEKEASRAVGVLGMPGLTGYLAFLNICKPKEGETVMVNACTGAVGSVVGQIAKIKGCKLVGSCGSEEKMEIAKSLGYDEVFNYKSESTLEALKRIAPQKIDCFFDNVGGQMSTDIMKHMNSYGKIAVIGAISGYNQSKPPLAEIVQEMFFKNQLEMKGFMIFDPKHQPEFADAVKQMTEWIEQGKLKVQETITNGFENIPQALIDQLNGKNIGKSVIRL